MLPTYKEIIDLIKKGSTFEAQEKIAQLKEEILSLREKNHELQDKVQELKTLLEQKGKLHWDGVIYWLEDEKNNKKEGPFCQRCYDTEQILVRLQQAEVSSRYWICLECKSNYFPSTYREGNI
jgi:hypothetical protein